MKVSTQSGVRFSELKCPVCQSKGKNHDGHWQCNNCHARFQFRVICDVCSLDVERIKACGGFEDYYCNSCSAPKSKSKVIFEFTAL